MSISLNGTLQTAQDSASHHIVVELKVSKDDDIPFDGEYLTSESTNEKKSNAIAHSSERLALVYTFGTDSLKYVYTDTARETFNFVTLSDSDLGVNSATIIEASICELVNGNIGIVIICSDITNYYLCEAVVNITGAVQSTDIIATYAKATYEDIKSPFVIKMSNNDYMLVYIIDDNATTSEIFMRTTSDFTSWGAESEIVPSGISDDCDKENVSLAEVDQDGSDVIFLWYDYGDGTHYYNIYYSISTDQGSSWSAQTKVTSYDEAIASGIHPYGVQKIADEIYLTYQQRQAALHYDKDDADWPTATDTGISQIVFDSATRQLYIVNSQIDAGYKQLYNLIKIDVDTWDIVDYWDDATTPAFNSMWTTGNINIFWEECDGEGHYIPIANNNAADKRFIALFDADAETIKEYYFDSWALHSITRNVYWSHWGYPPHDTPLSWYLLHVKIYSDVTRMYYLQYYAWVTSGQIEVGYFNTDTVADENGFYAPEVVLRDQGFSNADVIYMHDGCFEIVHDYETNKDFCFISSFSGQTATTGKLWVYDLMSSDLILSYVDYPYKPPVNIGTPGELKTSFIGGVNSFPYNGLKHFVVLGQTVYGSFEYQSGYGEEDHRGLAEINIDTGAVEYHRPSWATLNDYQLGQMTVTDDNKIVISTAGYGITIFDPADKTWERLTNANTPGLTEDGADSFLCIEYDNDSDIIFSNTAGVGNQKELIAVSINGYMQETYYQVGTYDAGWTFGAASEYIIGVTDYDAVTVLDPIDNVFYAFWTKQVSTEYSLKWDREADSFDLTPYIAADVPIIIERTIENQPARLTFTLASGHLFDPNNTNSLFKIYLKKGLALKFKVGEKVGGTDYFQDQGVFLVKEKKIVYERGRYPYSSVVCEDESRVWDDMQLAATELFDGTYPETILSDILTANTTWVVGDISIDNFDDRYQLYAQWVDVMVSDVLNEVTSLFGYYYRLNVDNDFVCKQITNDNSTDHTYSDSDTIIRFIPNDTYSDFTNRVTVVGEERDFMDVYYNEQALMTKNGTIGWWQGHERIRFPYSEDYSMRARNPRFDFQTQLQGIFRWGGSVSYSKDEDDEQLYCDLIIDGINLVSLLLELIGLITIRWALPSNKAGRTARGLLLIAIFDILGSVTNWQATLYAQPEGKVRRSIQATANDATNQNELGRTVEKIIEEPHCTTVEHCQELADRELLTTQMQRKSVQIVKIGHLQDEDGDTIQMTHPYTGDNIKFFVTRLRREIRKGSSSRNAGIMTDTIDGWIIDD